MSTLVICGRLGRDAELKTVRETSVCEFSVAVTSRPKKPDESTAWYRCAIWGTYGVTMSPYLTKGTLVQVSGELIPREYKGKNDELRTSLDVRVDRMNLLGGGDSSDKDVAPKRPKSAPAAASAEPDDDSIPF